MVPRVATLIVPLWSKLLPRHRPMAGSNNIKYTSTHLMSISFITLSPSPPMACFEITRNGVLISATTTPRTADRPHPLQGPQTNASIAYAERSWPPWPHVSCLRSLPQLSRDRRARGGLPNRNQGQFERDTKDIGHGRQRGPQFASHLDWKIEIMQ